MGGVKEQDRIKRSQDFYFGGTLSFLNFICLPGLCDCFSNFSKLWSNVYRQRSRSSEIIATTQNWFLRSIAEIEVQRLDLLICLKRSRLLLDIVRSALQRKHVFLPLESG